MNRAGHPRAAADLIVLADRVHTLDPRRPTAQAIAVRSGLIVGVGDRRDAHDWRGARTEVIDLGSATVTPGLVDGHIHPMLGLELTQGVDLSGVASLDELAGALCTERASHSGEWLLGWGLNPNDLKLVTAVFVLIALTLPDAMARLKPRRRA